MVFGLPDQLSAVGGDDEQAGGSNMKPTAKRREEMHQECRQHEAKSAAVAVSGIRGTLYRGFLAQGRLRPLASRRETAGQMDRYIPQGTQHEQQHLERSVDEEP